MDISIASRADRARAADALDASRPVLTRTLLATMAISCGLGIANLYYSQPLLGQIGRSLHASVTQVGTLPMLTQIGFAVGVFLLAPLGDVVEKKELILTLLALATVSLMAAALSPTLLCLAAVSLAIGITSVMSTLVMPFAVSLTRPEQRGSTVGTIASAMLIGILLSRTLSGFVGEAWGWRAMYGIAAALMVVLALLLRALLPVSRPAESLSYGELLRSTLKLIPAQPALREATANGMLLYGALTCFWTTLVFLVESPAYHYGPAAAGLFGLLGAVSAFSTPIAGKLSDRHSARVLVGAGILAMLSGFVILWAFGTHLWGLLLGVIILDIAAQGATVSNQTSIYTLDPRAQSRLYTVYRAAYSLGGSAGAFIGVLGWRLGGWPGVCMMGIALLLIALALHLRGTRR